MNAGKKKRERQDMDMTPMIDMTFQLIAFFMFTINFNNDILNKDVTLPVAELAQKVERAMVRPVFLNVNKEGVLLTGTNVGDIDLKDPDNEEKLMNYLKEEVALIQDEMYVASGRRQAPTDEVKATVIIRADQECEYGPVQDLIRACRVAGFGKYSLRAMTEPKKRS